METVEEGLSYRYWLHRDLSELDIGSGHLVFIMLNPSTADADNDDPTIRRCMAFGRQWAFKDLTVVNLFAVRSTDPWQLRAIGQASVGKHNDRVFRWLREDLPESTVVAAWGNQGSFFRRAAHVRTMLAEYPPLHALGFTSKGCPRHPLYLRKDAKLRRYPYSVDSPL